MSTSAGMTNITILVDNQASEDLAAESRLIIPVTPGKLSEAQPAAFSSKITREHGHGRTKTLGLRAANYTEAIPRVKPLRRKWPV